MVTQIQKCNLNYLDSSPLRCERFVWYNPNQGSLFQYQLDQRTLRNQHSFPL